MDQKAMYQLGYGLYVLTAKDQKDNGCIVNSVMQVSTSPNRVVVAVNKMNLTHDMIVQTGVFNVSVLTEQADFNVYRHFGYQSGKTVDKFADDTACARADNGLYYITEQTNAMFSGKVVHTVDCVTHTLFIADVTDAVVLGTGNSVTYAYYQKNIKQKPQQTTKSGYRCRICGYIYEGEDLPADFICPVCKHGAQDFEKIG